MKDNYQTSQSDAGGRNANTINESEKNDFNLRNFKVSWDEENNAILLTWKANIELEDQKLVILKRKCAQNIYEQEIEVSNVSSWRDQEIQKETCYHYEIGFKNEDSFKVLAQSEIKTPEQTASILEKEFTGQTKALPEPHKYQVVLIVKVRTKKGDVSKTIEKYSGDGKLVEVFNVLQNGPFIDANVFENQNYVYQLKINDKTLQNDEVSSALQVKAIIPRDYVIDNINEISPIEAERNYIGEGRLFFKANSQLITWGKKLNINVKEIISENAIIRTFPENHTAQSGEKGKPGGYIRIGAESAQGNLEVFALGEKGGKGLKGKPGNVGSKGRSGGAGQHKAQKHGEDDFTWICTSQAEKGGVGGKGEDGGVGGNGGTGGVSAQLVVVIKNQNGFKLIPHIAGGEGGDIGEGGDFGPGGPGGDGGSGPEGCGKMEQGQQGSNGKPGLSGKKGESGKLLKECFEFNSFKSCTDS
jgi:hypothetical protein